MGNHLIVTRSLADGVEFLLPVTDSLQFAAKNGGFLLILHLEFVPLHLNLRLLRLRSFGDANWRRPVIDDDGDEDDDDQDIQEDEGTNRRPLCGERDGVLGVGA